MSGRSSVEVVRKPYSNKKLMLILYVPSRREEKYRWMTRGKIISHNEFCVLIENVGANGCKVKKRQRDKPPDVRS